MTPDPNVDRALAECWLISDRIIAEIREQVEALKADANQWEPAPCPAR